jgi:hypothetical protein
MEQPHLTPVTSSNIDAVGYHDDSRTLHVRFTSGATYKYRDVDPTEHEALVAAKSVGSHFAKHIRPHYTGEKQ